MYLILRFKHLLLVKEIELSIGMKEEEHEHQ